MHRQLYADAHGQGPGADTTIQFALHDDGPRQFPAVKTGEQ